MILLMKLKPCVNICNPIVSIGLQWELKYVNNYLYALKRYDYDQ